MGKAKTLTIQERTKISTLSEEGYSNRKIAEKIGRSTWVVNNFLKDPENYGANRKGRTKQATSARERRLILQKASNFMGTAREIASMVETSASLRTVRRIIASAPHLQRLKLKKKPCLQERHRLARLEFARTHVTWKDEWLQVVFSDEKKFNIDGPDGFSFYFHDLRKEEKFLSRRHSSVGSVMVWGAISVHGPVDLVFISGKQNGEKYKELMQTEVFKINEIFEGRSWIYQQDNASIHNARVVRNWFEDNNVEVLPWPALSPDFNIIENVWGWLTRKV